MSRAPHHHRPWYDATQPVQWVQVSISKAREVYRPVAVRGSLLYFLVDSLNSLDRVYHYSMAAFVQSLKKGGALLPSAAVLIPQHW